MEVTSKGRLTRRTILRKLFRVHVARLNKCLYASSGADTVNDDFIIYLVPEANIGTDTVILPIDPEFIGAKERWVALIINDKPYLISRSDCLSLQHIDNSVHVDIRAIMNIPEKEEEVDEEDAGMEVENETSPSVSPPSTPTLSVSTGLSISRGGGVTASNTWYERNNETIIRPMRRKHGIFVETPYRLFSLARHIKEGGIREEQYKADQEINQYMKMVLDYALIGANFGNHEHRLILENKLLAYYNNEVMHNDENAILNREPHLFFVFMINVILCETEVLPLDTPYFDNTSIRYQYPDQIKCRMMDACISWELFKLRRSRDRTITDKHYQALINEFMVFIGQYRYIPRPEWTLYGVDTANPNEFWWATDKTGDDRLFLIRFEWVPSLIADGMASSISDRVKEGNVWLSVTEFYDYFLPRLYHNLLRDSFLYIWMCRFAHRDDKFVQSFSLVQLENFKTLVYQHLPQHDARATSILAFSKEKLSALESPITKIVTKRDELMPSRTTLGSSFTTQLMTIDDAATISKEIDIEELHQYLPPCLKSLVKKNTHLTWMDRVTAVSFLYDMGYSEKDTIRQLNGCDNHDIRGHYRSNKKIQTKKQREELRPEQAERILMSVCCNAIMSIDGSRGHSIRCPYEATANGPKRKKKEEYLVGEKLGYRTTCGIMIDPTVSCISSPLEYVKQKHEFSK